MCITTGKRENIPLSNLMVQVSLLFYYRVRPPLPSKYDLGLILPIMVRYQARNGYLVPVCAVCSLYVRPVTSWQHESMSTSELNDQGKQINNTIELIVPGTPTS